MHPMLNIAIRAARKAGNHIAKSLENAEKIESTQKGANDFVTNVDKEAHLNNYKLDANLMLQKSYGKKADNNRV